MDRLNIKEVEQSTLNWKNFNQASTDDRESEYLPWAKMTILASGKNFRRLLSMETKKHLSQVSPMRLQLSDDDKTFEPVVSLCHLSCLRYNVESKESRAMT